MTRRAYGRDPEKDVKYFSSARAVNNEAQDQTAGRRASNHDVPFDEFKTRKTATKSKASSKVSARSAVKRGGKKRAKSGRE